MATKRTTFPLEMITTRADGSIVLEGGGRVIIVHRAAPKHSNAATWSDPRIIARDDDHSVTVREILESGSIAF